MFHIVSGADTPNKLETVANDDLSGEGEVEARGSKRRLVDEDLVSAVEGVKVICQVAQIMHQGVRCAIRRALLDDFRERAQALDQLLFLRFDQQPERARSGPGLMGEPALLQLPLHARDARVRILDVVDRVVVGSRLGELEVEIQMLVVAAHDVEQPSRIVTHLVAQLAQGDELARTGRHLRLLSAAKQRDELDQAHLETLRRSSESSQTGAQPGDVAVVIGAPHVEQVLEAAFALVEDESDVGRKVGLDAVFADHHAILLVAVGGASEPNGAVLHVGVSSLQ